MKEGRLKGPAGGLRAVCGRCNYLYIITGTGGPPELTTEEEELIKDGAAKIWESNSPPGTADMCPRCLGDAWNYKR